MAATSKIDLVAIVGPTASGKSALAMKVARQFNGEIISADSRTIYKGMDIGTAKPSKEEQAGIPHWGLDLVEPGHNYSAQKFKEYASQKIADINSHAKLAILVGGSGLYIDSVLYDFQFGLAVDHRLRAELENLDVDELQAMINRRGLAMPENFKNKRHLIRTVERQGEAGSKKDLRPNALVIGLALPDKRLKSNIKARAGSVFKGGIIEETKGLINKYGEAAILKTGGIVYKICIRLLAGEIDEQTAETTFVQLDWQYARRQRTWLRRNSDIQWFESPQKAFLHLKTVLST
jgi:tRNA dimethylallyltransferase